MFELNDSEKELYAQFSDTKRYEAVEEIQGVYESLGDYFEDIINMVYSLETESEVENVEEDDKEHLEDLEDGAGCTDIWEHLSEKRQEDYDDQDEE